MPQKGGGDPAGARTLQIMVHGKYTRPGLPRPQMVELVL